jgi:hypothetical protein
LLSVTDAELKASIDQIILSNGFNGIVIDVKDNVLIWRSRPSPDELSRFYAALRQSNIRTRGEDHSQQ